MPDRQLVMDHDRLPGSTLAHAEVTNRQEILNVFGVPPTATWPYEDFAVYLRALMDAQKIKDFAELSRLTGVSQTQFSHWRHGRAQPSRESLAKIAPVLDVPPVHLWIAADLAGPADLDLAEQPDLTAIPSEFRRLLDLYTASADDERRFLRLAVSRLVAGVGAEQTTQPGSNPRRPPRAG